MFTFKDAFTEAFKTLRRQGYFARQSHTCCSSCGWAEVPDEKAGKAVFYHRQDADGLDRGRVHLAWSGNGTEICKAFKDLGLVTNWDGSAATRIEVIMMPGTLPRVEAAVTKAIGDRMRAKR